MVKAVSDISQLREYIEEMVRRINPNALASTLNNVYQKDPDKQDLYGKAINTAIMEISTTLPTSNMGTRTVYTTYYLSDEPGGFRLIRHTTPTKSLMTQVLDEEIKLRDSVHKAMKQAVTDDTQESYSIQYERLFKEIFAKIIKDFPSLGGNTSGLLDKALIRKCKFVRVENGTLSVGYSPIDKKYIVRYNPKFCIDATLEYFANPVLDEQGNYRAGTVTEDNVLFPIMFFLSHEFAHVLYRHVTNSNDSVQADLPHYAKQYFGDAYINNSMPYLLGSDFGRTNSGDQSEIHKAKSHHPIGINEQVPVDNYLKKSYATEIYKTLQSQDVSLLDNNIADNLKKYVDILTPPKVKSAMKDDLGFGDVSQFSTFLAALPPDIQKMILKSHLKFFTGNFYDVMSRIFTQGFSSNSYMRVLKAILDSLFEDIKDTQASTKKQPPKQQQQGQQGDQGDQGDQGEGQEGQGQEGQQGEGGDRQQGQSAEGQQGDGQEGEGDSDGEGQGESDGDGSNGDQTRSKYGVGDYVRQVSTGKIGKITSIEDDGTYVIDTSVTLEEGLDLMTKLMRLVESVIRVGEEDLEPYDHNSKGDGQGNSGEGDGTGDEGDDSGEGQSGDQQGDGEGQEGDSADPQGDADEQGDGQDSGDQSGGGSGGDSGGDSGDGGSGSGSGSGSGAGDGVGDGSVNPLNDGYDDLRRQIEESQEDSKSGLSDSANDYIEQDDATRQEADRELDDTEAKDEIGKSVQEAIDEAKERGEKVEEVFKNMDKDEIAEAFNVDMEGRDKQISTSTWKKMFRQLISQASGYDLQRDNARPSRKVEGLWGATKKVPSISNVVILLDGSYSMSSTMFKAIFAELQNLGKLPELKDTWVHVIPWADSAMYKRFKGFSPPSVKQMYVYGKATFGTTYPAYGYQMMMEKVRNPDLVLFLSDCEFSHGNKRMDFGYSRRGGGDKDLDKLHSYVKRVARKTVYINIGGERAEKQLLTIDPTYKRRLISLDPSVSSSGGDDLDD